MEPVLEIKLLGGFRVNYKGVQIQALKTPRLRLILAILALRPGMSQLRSQIAFSFWPDSNEKQAYANLRHLIHRLIQILPQADCFLHRDRQTLTWRVDAPCLVDVVEFETLLNKAETIENKTEQKQYLKKAFALWQGKLMPDCYEEWVIERRKLLDQQYYNMLQQLLGLVEYERDFEDAIRIGEVLFNIDQTSEENCCRLMGLYAKAGKRNEISKVFKLCKAQLRKELDVEADASTLAVYNRLVNSSVLNDQYSQDNIDNSPFIGRHQQWSELGQAWKEVSKGAFKVVVITGNAGVGKTRLAEEFASWVTSQGYLALKGYCYSNERWLAYSPIRDWLQTDFVSKKLQSLHPKWQLEISRLIPELVKADVSIPPLSELWQQQRFFEALRLAVKSLEQPLLLLLDDLQYLDSESLNWLQYFFSRSKLDSILLIITSRSGYSYRKEVEDFELTFKLAGAWSQLELSSFSKGETQALASSLCRGDLSQDYLDILYRETEGNPLFIIELIKTGVLNDKDKHSIVISPTVQATIQRHLALLSVNTQNYLELAAVIGRSFDFRLLNEAGRGLGDELRGLKCLEEAVERHIIKDQQDGSYVFSHEKYREVIFSKLSAARIRTFHKWVGEILAQQAKSGYRVNNGRVGYHFEQAGLIEQAVPYYLQEADEAKRIWAHADVKLALTRCLEFLKASNSLDLLAEVLEKLGDLDAHLGKNELARQAYLESISNLAVNNLTQLSKLWVKIAQTYCSQRKANEIKEACLKAEQALKMIDNKAKDCWASKWIDIQFVKATAYYLQGNLKQHDQLIKNITEIVAKYGNASQRFDFVKSLMYIDLRRGRFYVTESLLNLVYKQNSLANALDNPLQYQVSQFNLGFCLLWAGKISEAILVLRKCLRGAMQTGYQFIIMLSLVYLGIAWRKLGRIDRAKMCGIYALKIAQEESNLCYVAAARGVLAWVFYRSNDFAKTREYAENALKDWQQLKMIYPFEWLARFPLLGVALREKKWEEALKQAKYLLDSRQAILPKAIAAQLNNALSSQGERVLISLKKVVELAQVDGYL